MLIPDELLASKMSSWSFYMLDLIRLLLSLIFLIFTLEGEVHSVVSVEYLCGLEFWLSGLDILTLRLLRIMVFGSYCSIEDE
jgi:hypothetical protein